MSRVIRAVLLSLLAIWLVALPVLAAYSATYAITESNGTAYAMLPVRVAANSTWMASNGFMSSTALDTRVQTLGGSEFPHLVADDKILTAVPVPADSQTNLYFTTGNSALTSMYIVLGNSGYFTVADNPAMEPGANWEVEIRGYFDTSVASDILTKGVAPIVFELSVSAAQTVRMQGNGWGDILTWNPVTSGIHTIRVTEAAGTARLFIDGVERDSGATVGIANDVNSWVAMGGSGNEYWEYYKHTVGGTLIAHYQPVTIISGTTLPDQEGAAQNGVITWGTNPAGVTVALGSLVSSSQPSIGVATTTPTRDILPTATPSKSWFEEPDVSGTLLTNPFRPFVTILSDTTTLTERQAWVWLGIAFVLFVLVLTAKSVRGHYLISGIATCGAILTMIVMTVFPIWALVFAVLAILGGMVAERSPTL